MTISAKAAYKLRADWKGGHCDHSERLLREYIKGMSTNDYVCPICGESGWGPNWVKDKLGTSQTKEPQQ